MKRHWMIALLIALLLISAAGCSGQKAENGTASSAHAAAKTSPVSSAENTAAASMAVSSAGITDGFIDPVYGMNGDDLKNGIPLRSLPLAIENAPQGTVCFALLMEDPDSEPIAGFRWVHWIAVNITDSELPEDYSRTAAGRIVQGKNDFETVGYGGPTPPDKDHNYVITVYALDAKLDLQNGFQKADLIKAVKGHMLGEASLEGVYKK
ncbi:MAG: YbhB/YbcL family Raf kinase inhibitor-like protein [Christensenellales bacterium]